MKNIVKFKESTLFRREKKLAFLLLLPTIFLVLSIVLIPLFANFWISFKPITLSDLRPPKLIIKENVRGKLSFNGEIAQIQYRYRNSSTKYDLKNVILTDHNITEMIRTFNTKDLRKKNHTIILLTISIVWYFGTSF